MPSRATTTARPRALRRPQSCITRTSSTVRRPPAQSATTDVAWRHCWPLPARSAGASATSSEASPHVGSPCSRCWSSRRSSGSSASTWVLLSGDAVPGLGEIAAAGAGGIAALVGLAALYRGFAIGAMGIVAPISAASPLVPLAVDVGHGITPSTAQWLGLVLVVTGIVSLSWEPSNTAARRIAAGAGLAIVAALGFGFFFVGIDAGADESSAWAVAAARTASVPVAVAAALALRTPLTAPRRLLPMLVAVGVFDTGANIMVAAASARDAIGIVAVLSSLYPIVTVVLAWLVLGEHLPRAKRQAGGRARRCCTRRRRLDVEADVEDVPVLDDVGLALEPLETASRGLRMRAALDEVVPADHLAADEAACDVGVD